MKLSIFLLPLIGVMTMQSAWAEGSTINDGIQFGETAGARAGNNGVNRVIRTKAGYRAVRGTVDLSFVMPKNENIGNHSYEQVDDAGNFLLADLDHKNGNESGVLDDLVQPLNQNTNMSDGVVLPPKGNKPSAYLGGTLDSTTANLRTHIDCGLQYEPLTLYNTEPGWGIFFRVSDTRIPDAAGNNVTSFTTNPKVPNGTPDGRPWRSQGSGSTNEITSTMLFEATNSGSGRFDWSPVGTIYANLGRNQLAANQRVRWDITPAHSVVPWADGANPNTFPPTLFDTGAYNTADVKRVTALTRDEPYTSQLDGSQVRAVWSACEVIPQGANLRDWLETDVNQGRTGYDAPREGDFAFDRRFDTHRTVFSRPIVEFAPISQILPDGSTHVVSSDTLRQEMGIASRYLNETVIFNFGTLARPVGGKLQ